MARSRNVDHIVLAVPDLDRAAATYEQLGFTLTPRARHPDSMGTANRLVQLADQSFIELLEVDRPTTQEPHAFDETPPRFSFGAHNRDFLNRGSGLSMLAFAGDDCRADLASFDAAGLRTYAPFAFERCARQPDGSETPVGATLGFVTSPAMPRLAFFICQDHFPESFWNPAFLDHANGAQGIAAITLAAERPEEHRDFLGVLTASPGVPVPGGLSFTCGRQDLRVVTPDTLATVTSLDEFDLSLGPQFVAITLRSDRNGLREVPAGSACGAFIEWARQA